jgi:hypothetical protein
VETVRDFFTMASFQSFSASKSGTTARGDVVEIGLLLPVNRAEALLELAKQRQQSVAQILRSLIDRALHDVDDRTPRR